MQLRIDNSAMKDYVKKLKQLHKSALPVVVRQTLNSVMYDVKQNTMLNQADKTFEKRNKNFIKANTGIAPAKGFDINKMIATIGVKPSKADKSRAADNLEQQEKGGKIDSRAHIPLKESRIGQNWQKIQRKQNQVTKIGKINNSRRVKGKSQKEKFVKASIKAGIGKLVMGNMENDRRNRTIYRITKIGRTQIQRKRGGGMRDGPTFVNIVPLFSVKRGRRINVKATNFMKKASLESQKKAGIFFKKHAENKINQLTRR